MPFDGISANFLMPELQAHLLGARVNRVFQPGRYELFLQFRRPGSMQGLFLSANPSRPAAYLSGKPSGNPKEAPSFCMLLRKELIGAELTAITQTPCERIFHFHFRGRNELGDEETKTLVAELTGRHSNLLLLRADGIIHETIRHIDHSVNRLRELMPARPYQEPPTQNKRLPEALLKEDKNDLFSFLKDEKLGAKKLLYLLNDELAGFSPLLCRELLFRSGLAEERSLDSLSLSEQQTLSVALRAMLEDICHLKASPALYYLSSDELRAVEFHAMELKLFPRSKRCSSLSACMENYFGVSLERERFREEAQRLERELKRLRKQNARKTLLHEGDFAEGKKADEYRKKGELLQSRVYSLKEHSSYLETEDYYREGFPLLRIELDEKLSPSANVERYFRLYRKAREKFARAGAYLENDHAETVWLDSLEAALARAEEMEDLRAIEAELRLTASLPRKEQEGRERPADPVIPLGQMLNPGKPGKKKYKKTAKKQNGKKKEAPPQAASLLRRYLSSQGRLIESGRNNVDNERLSLRRARKDDLWFHARNIPGAHVILHTAGQPAEALEIEEAATVAAWFSAANQAGLGGKVTVDYCPVKNVSKIRGGRPGQVNYRDFFSVLVEARRPGAFLKLPDEQEEKEI